MHHVRAKWMHEHSHPHVPTSKNIRYSWVQLGTVGYSWIQLGTVGYGWVQMDTDGYRWIQLDTDISKIWIQIYLIYLDTALL